MDQLLLNADEVSKTLKIGRSKTYEMMASGELPVVRIGRSVRVPAKALEERVKTWAESDVPARDE